MYPSIYTLFPETFFLFTWRTRARAHLSDGGSIHESYESSSVEPLGTSDATSSNVKSNGSATTGDAADAAAGGIESTTWTFEAEFRAELRNENGIQTKKMLLKKIRN